jgi:hypothetical protein
VGQDGALAVPPSRARVLSLANPLLGDRFHRAVDRAGTEEFEAVPPLRRRGELEEGPETDTEVHEERTAEQEEDTEPVVWQP